jgi:hypothetical protein
MIQIFKNSGTDTVFSIGQMVPTMKVSGTLIRQRGRAPSGMPKEMYTAENSRMIWQMGMASTPISMDPSIKESSKMTYKKVTEKKNGSMGPSMLDPT